MHFAKSIIASAIASLLIGPAQAQDVSKGAKLAQELCARCHDVTADGPFKLYPPSFAAIAAYRTGEFIFSRILYSPVHSGMPQMGEMLTREQVADLLVYIGSVERK